MTFLTTTQEPIHLEYFKRGDRIVIEAIIYAPSNDDEASSFKKLK